MKSRKENKKDLKQFVLDTLLPYKKNPFLCAIENHRKYGTTCSYLTEDGRQCAVGKHMREGEWQKFNGGFLALLTRWNKEEVLTEEAHDINISNLAWTFMQNYHDDVAMSSMTEDRINIIKKIEKALNITLDELK